MNRFTRIAAQIVSVILYPLFVPTYGMALFCLGCAQRGLPLLSVWVIVALCGTFLLTCLLPLTSIWIMLKRGEISSLYIEQAHERTMPYLYAAVGFVFWCYLLISILHAPMYICSIGVGATVAISLVALINRRWKISAHLTGFGGLIGGLMSYYLGIGELPSWGVLCTCLVLSLLLMCARLRLDAHTPTQVCVGWLLGIACTYVPYWLVVYVAS